MSKIASELFGQANVGLHRDVGQPPFFFTGNHSIFTPQRFSTASINCWLLRAVRIPIGPDSSQRGYILLLRLGCHRGDC